MLKRKIIIVILAIFLLVAGLSVAFNLKSEKPELTDEQIRERLGCNRMTLDWRSTDIYCNYPQAYRDKVKSGEIKPLALPDEPSYP